MMNMKCIVPWMSVAVMLFMSGCSTPKAVGGKISNKDLIDGEYQGTATGGPVKAIVAITILDQKVTQVKILKHRTGRGKPAETVIPGRIIEQQSTAVDAVTGATLSSVTIMNAAEDAVRKALKQASTQSADAPST